MSIATDRPTFVIALIAGPIFGEHLPKRLLKFGQELAGLLPSHQIQFSCPRVEGEAHKLNMLIDEFRLEPANEWLFFWNEKIPITPAQIVTLVGAKVGIVGALYSGKEERAVWHASFYPDLPAGENQLLAVPELEMGAKLYHRTAFDFLEKKHEKLHYIFDQSGRTIQGFCQERILPVLDYQRLCSPSNFLDSLCREAGLYIYAHVGVIINRAKKEPYRPWEHPRKPAPVCAEELPTATKNDRPILVCIQYCDKDKEAGQRLRAHLEHQGIEPMMVYSPGDKYPAGPNETALRLLRLEPSPLYKAVLLIEPDCVPVTKDWLDQLSDSWDRASSAGKLVMGSCSPSDSLGHLPSRCIRAVLVQDGTD
jgi:hypothetical protein